MCGNRASRTGPSGILWLIRGCRQPAAGRALSPPNRFPSRHPRRPLPICRLQTSFRAVRHKAGLSRKRIQMRSGCRETSLPLRPVSLPRIRSIGVSSWLPRNPEMRLVHPGKQPARSDPCGLRRLLHSKYRVLATSHPSGMAHRYRAPSHLPDSMAGSRRPHLVAPLRTAASNGSSRCRAMAFADCLRGPYRIGPLRRAQQT
jgi:hypothetical protein